MYKVDTSVGMPPTITTYTIGVYAITCSISSQFTLGFTGQTDSVFSISDYSKATANVLGTSTTSATYTGNAINILIPEDALYFVASVSGLKIVKVNQDPLGVVSEIVLAGPYAYLNGLTQVPGTTDFIASVDNS